jgi:hypothetical protein
MDSQKKVRGCDGYKGVNKFRFFENETIELLRCPVKSVEVASRLYLEAYHFYKQGMLPNSGTWNEQPSKLIEVFMFLDGFMAELEEIKQKENLEKMRRK